MNFTKPSQIFSRRHEQREATLSQLWCTVRVKSDLWTQAKKYFIDVFPLFWENQLKKEMTFISEKKQKSEELECVIFIPSFNLLYIVLTEDVGNFMFFSSITIFTQGILQSVKNGRRRRTLPYLYTIYICLHYNIVRPTVRDSRWHNIEPSHDKTWLHCVRRITTQISLRICTV